MMTASAMAENHQPAGFNARGTVVAVGLVGFAIMTFPLDAQQASPSQRAAQQPEPVRYTVSFPAPQTHYAEIAADFPTGGAPSIDLFMPVWTPGSYLVREFSRNVEDLKGPGSVVKTTKNRWRVETGGAT